MFEKGSYVVNANNGICEVTDIVTMNMSGEDKEYYVLTPLEEKTAKVFLPVDIAPKRIRRVMQKEEAWTLIKEIKAVDEALIENEKEREKIYKDAVNSRDPKRLISIIKTLYIRKQQRLEAGKKNTSVDERYFKLAENNLYNELAFSLEVDRTQVKDIIMTHVNA